MDCARFRELFDSLPASTDEDFDAWAEHERACRECSDAWLAHKVRARGGVPADWPCVHLAFQATRACDRHETAMECPDAAVVYEPRFREWGLPVRDGEDAAATSYIVIRNCPWCGEAVPPSLRTEWFAALARRGFANPLATWDEIPEAFLSDAWWREEA